MLVINLFGAPGAGKSTEAARWYVALKDEGYNAELVRETAKTACWEGTLAAGNKTPFYYVAQQAHAQEILRGKVDVIVTDAPLLQHAVYADYTISGQDQVFVDIFNGFININFFIPRGKPYNPKGRTQSSEQSMRLQDQILDLLNNYGVSFYTHKSGGIDPSHIDFVKKFLEHLQQR